MPQQGTGFVSLGQYLAANQGAVGNMANSLAGRDAQEGADAENADNSVANTAEQGYAGQGGAYDPTSLADFTTAQNKTANAAQDISGLGQDGFTQQQLQRQYGGKGDYSNDDASFDSSLLGGSDQAQSAFNQVKGQYAGLGDYLTNAMNNAQTKGMAAYNTPYQSTPGQPFDNPENPVNANTPGGYFDTNNGPGSVDPEWMKPTLGRGGSSRRGSKQQDNGDF